MAIATTTHPLEPLAAEEISAAADLLRTSGDLAEPRFVFIMLHEPPKEAVRAWSADGPTPAREAFVVLRDRATRGTYEAVVSLTAERVVYVERKDGVQAPITMEEFMATAELVRADERWQEAMRARGVEDFEMCMLDPWSASCTGPGDHPDLRRIVRPLTWLRVGDPDDNGYARPAEGLVVVVDLDAMEVAEVSDYGIVAFPPKSGNYVPRLLLREPDNVPAVETLRSDVKPIEITQPEGPSFAVDGHEVRWQKWRLRLGFNGREGLTLHQVGYEDSGRLRPVLSRASLSEMWIPYGDPAPTHAFKNVFDMGEYGIGWLANPLELGCDCLGEIRYFDGVINDQDGAAVTIPNAVCMHEEDYGIGWKHTDFRSEKVEVRRQRRLVISMIATVGNYEYGYFWYLYTDGTIEYEVKLSGVISTGAVAPGERPEHGTLVAPGLYGPHHQHFFSVRLDMEVDGERNSVVEVDSEPLAMGPDNPVGNAWVTKRTVLERESQAQRVVDPYKARFWRIENPGVENAVGDPVAYKLMPGETCLPMVSPDGAFGSRAQFAYKHLWVTPYDPRERYAAGDYPNQHPGARACRSGPRPTARSPIATSSSGTRSAPTTSSAPRTGP
ncbi:MAG: primary-amine oxidase [Solirubrobacteraceae bacterium]